MIWQDKDLEGTFAVFTGAKASEMHDPHDSAAGQGQTYFNNYLGHDNNAFVAAKRNKEDFKHQRIGFFHCLPNK